MSTTNAVEQLYDSTLQPRIAALEGLRLSLRSYIVKSGLLIGVPAAIFMFRGVIGFLLPAGVNAFIGPIAFAGIFVGVVIAGVRYLLPGMTAYTNYTARFKQEVVTEIFKIVCPTAQYAPHQGIAKDVFDAAGVFGTGDSYQSDDRVRGRIGQTPFEAADVKRTYTTGTGDDAKTHVVFHGLFFHFDFNKALRGVTIVEPESASAYQTGSRSGLKVVAFEDPIFEKEFKVYASDDVEARYVLTPAMMERLLAVRAATGKPIFLGFRDGSAYLGIHYGRALFEPGIAATTSKAAILEMATHFGLAETIVHELDLNTRIWTKDVDASLLERTEYEKNELLELAAAKAGTLTEKDLWAKAQASIGHDYDKETGTRVPKPPRTRVRIEQSGTDATDIRYGFSFSFFFAMLVSLLSVAIAASALHELAKTELFFGLERYASRLPTIAALDGVVGENGMVWLGVAAVIGLLFTFGWWVRVRRVVVAPDAVLVYRGIKPYAKRYARSEYNDVLRMKNSVHLARGAGVTLFNPTASPNLSEADAGWVASELRAALRGATAGL